MLHKLLDVLICPNCLPHEFPLQATIGKAKADDIIAGELSCCVCARRYPIEAGVAYLDPGTTTREELPQSRYESQELLASYLWSHYGDLLAEAEASSAYREWGQLLPATGGWGLDIGAAVGRFSFEMSQTCDFVIGIDASSSFIRAARRLLREGSFSVNLPEEGNLFRHFCLHLPSAWAAAAIEFIVADAQALPFRTGIFRQTASLNLVDKLPQPLRHLSEMNRVASRRSCHFLFSDPFSWSTAAAPESEWLGGTSSGEFKGYGQDNLKTLLSAPQGRLQPAWRVVGEGSVWWKIRTHRNHYELIRSCYLQAER
ncbi:MAG: methyltransferase domain-containing protein [Deltaproteobacteria bacterium]|nr:methyltransferase domain-containing protein [Deltaproteobacteria bacterium]